MHMTKVLGLLLVLLCCELCSTIKVPITWNESFNSEVKNEHLETNPVEIILPQNVQVNRPPDQQPIPIEYFEYTAQKPKFAADIAAFHGAQNAQQHYKAYPVRPYTGIQKPTLGIHHILTDDKSTFQPFQNYIHQNAETTSFVNPSSTNYEVFHPYKAEEPALQEIYKDPVLTKIRSDLQDSKNRLQAYEQQAGEPNITKDEYLESPDKTDDNFFPHKNVPARYEIHRPERRPVYYKAPPREFHRDHVLNKKFKHPWNQNAKIRPIYYRPLHNHIHHLRQHHAMKYGDERNEYPQVPVFENIAEPQDGYDIYEKGKQKYTQLRNNLDESINQIVQKNRPPTYQKLELQKHEPNEDDEKDEFIPVKNYAQVRKVETFKHLPKKAAFDDAETYEEILNAPRLREAVKSTKAQTVYTEEGYEDSAFDHAGEQKHACDHEGHGGFLKEHENSGGLYKIPTFSGKYQDGRGSEYQDKTEHGEKWKNDKKDDEEETKDEDYSEVEQEEDVDAETFKDDDPESDSRSKRHDDTDNDKSNDGDHDSDSDNDSDIDDDSDSNTDKQITRFIRPYKTHTPPHEVDKREIDFKVPEINLNSTLTLKNGSKLEKQKVEPEKETIQEKYPYYFKNLKGINKNSPLKYAENLKFIPKKSNGGAEFYDSRSRFECPDVDEEVDPLPEKLKNGENPTEDDDGNEEESKSKGKKGFDAIKKQPRLKGLGDKIDCFKAKYFGENPLDSPFFKEKYISHPEPITAPNLPTYKLKNIKGDSGPESKINNVIASSKQLKEADKTNIFVLLDKLGSDQNYLQEFLNKTNEATKNISNDTQQANMYIDILKHIKNNIQHSEGKPVASASLLNSDTGHPNVTYEFFQNKEDVTKTPTKLRKRRATPFIYEPYKMIRDSQVQDSKKTTTTSNISPLIKQLQSSRVADRVSRSNKDDKHVNQKTNSRAYVDIGQKDRAKPSRSANDNSDATFVDVSVDQRRGEPRYELRPANHKSVYTPVENKRAMSIYAYKSQTTTEQNEYQRPKQRPNRGRQRFRLTPSTTTKRPDIDVTQYIPKSIDIHNVAASNAVKKTVKSSTPKVTTDKHEDNEEESDEAIDYQDDEDEEDEDEDDVEEIAMTINPKPSFRRTMRVTTTTEKIPEHSTEAQRLKLVTRFRNYKTDEKTETEMEPTERTQQLDENTYDKADNITAPKYREKKKKSHKSTLVTDTKQYGDDDEEENDMRKEEVDAMIRVKHDMDDYTPMYEKEEEGKNKKQQSKHDEENNDEYEEDEENDDYDDVDDDDDDYDDIGGEDEGEEKPDVEPEGTTPEPTKRTLVRTTEASPATKATHVHREDTTAAPQMIKSVNKPVVTRKRIEIHKELPVNKSSPHVTQFKQDIKEIEIIKEMPAMPKKKLQNNVGALNLYKDDDLAKSVNSLGDVDIFRENIDLDRGPKHGGNYRQATKEDLRLFKPREKTTKPPKDAETAQSENNKHVELDEYTPKKLHGGNLKSLSGIKRSRKNDRSAKLIELSESTERTMHGGNLKYDSKRRGNRKSEKLIELDEDNDEDHSSRQDNNNKSHNLKKERMHGGNYRSAKLVTPTETTDDDIQVKSSTKNARRTSAELLIGFAQAVPILTSTPGYIVDPSKRMYYYVDA